LKLLVLIFFVASSASASSFIVDISNPSFRRLMTAIPVFFTLDTDKDTQEVAKEASAYLAEILQFSGFFNIVNENAFQDIVKKMQADPGNYKTDANHFLAKNGMNGFDVNAWKTIGMESVTIAQLSKTKDSFTLTIRTMDVNKQRMVVGKRYSGFVRSDLQKVLRRYGDQVLEAYTGRPGIYHSKIAFIGRKSAKDDMHLFVCDFDGSNVIQVTKGRFPNMSPSWSKDGRFIIFTSYMRGQPGLFRYELATGKLTPVFQDKGQTSGANFSASNKILAFTYQPDNIANIFYIPAEGGSKKLLVAGPNLDVEPAFSPNGKWLAFVSGRFGNPHIFIADLNWRSSVDVVLGPIRRLTFAGWYNATPSWSYDSQKIAFAGFDKDINRFDLFMMNPDGRQLDRLTLNSGDNERPTWSPNSQMLVFHSNRTSRLKQKGQTKLFVMNRDGSNQRALNIPLHSAEMADWSPQIAP
jgi:TolB protein